ncbi:fluoride efflux transporter FluC [Algiphilus sp.]|uniref:fluoride efflux transporter FluC n=1 Tax=Algiphilus sp. TaxID=1872431 RepID=UPI0025C6E779|nr:CrcB family protein [Algiphilus sp.]MCK5771840.1 CrcB family protein [Algiphilus sp.]
MNGVRTTALVAAGSALGGGLRVALSVSIALPGAATLLVNVLGAAVMGAAAHRLLERDRPQLQAFLLPGFCGGFTSLSTFSWEWVQLARSVEPSPGAALLLGGALAAALAAWMTGAAAGWWLGGAAARRRGARHR